MKLPFLLGRVVFGGFFLYNGIHHLIEHKHLAQYAAAKKVPLADPAVVTSGIVLVAGGASLIAGVKPKFGAAAVIGFLAGVSPVMHDFWNIEDPEKRMNEMINFSKNMALLGGALALMSIKEPWPASVPFGHPQETDRLDSGSRQLAA